MQAVGDNLRVVAQSDLIFLAVKPQQMADVAAGLRGKLAGERLIVSLAAGVRLATLTEWLGPELRIIRVMPNAPCLVGQGACGYCLGPRATAADGAVVERLLSAVGSALAIEGRAVGRGDRPGGLGPGVRLRGDRGPQ